MLPYAGLAYAVPEPCPPRPPREPPELPQSWLVPVWGPARYPPPVALRRPSVSTVMLVAGNEVHCMIFKTANGRILTVLPEF